MDAYMERSSVVSARVAKFLAEHAERLAAFAADTTCAAAWLASHPQCAVRAWLRWFGTWSIPARAPRHKPGCFHPSHLPSVPADRRSVDAVMWPHVLQVLVGSSATAMAAEAAETTALVCMHFPPRPSSGAQAVSMRGRADSTTDQRRAIVAPIAKTRVCWHRARCIGVV